MNSRRIRCAILVSTCLCSSLAWATDWVDLGPAPIGGVNYSGRVSAIACSPTDADRYFIAGADGGVWRSTDGGKSWTPLTDDLPTTAIGALAIDPTDENILYAGSGEANFANHSRYGLGLYKSTDGGDTWTVLAADTFAGRCFSRIVVNPQDPQILYAAITQAGGFPEKAAAKGHPLKDGPYGVFRSSDGGETWEQLTNGLPNLSATDVAMDPTDPGILYAGIGHIFGSGDNGLYKSEDGGESWSKITGGGFPSSDVGRISIAVAPSNADRIYLLIAQKADASGGSAETLGGYRSNDGGKNWTKLSNLGNIQATYGWYLCIVGVDPSNADVVFMGGLDLARSTNAGSSWAYVTPPHVDLHAIAWDASGRILVGDDGGVHRTTNRGNSWSALNPGLGCLQFYAGVSTHPTNADIVLGGFQDNGSNLRKSDSRSWTNVFGGDGGWTQIDARNGNRMFVEYQGTGNLYYSSNGGTSFNYSGNGINSNDRNCFLPPYLIDPNDSKRMLYATHRVYRSTNSGGSWSAISGDLTKGGSASVRALAIAPSDSNVVYAATNDSRVLVSDDGGAHFTLVEEDAPGWPRVTREIFVDPANADTVYLAVANFGQTQIRRSTDRGQSWEALDAEFPDTPVNCLAVDVRGGKPTIYAGTDGGLYRSANGGATWHRYGIGLPSGAVIDIRLEVDRGRLIVGTQGRGAWRIGVALPGDMNGDETVTLDDIDPFVLALVDPDEFHAQFPNVDVILAGDLNGDGQFDFGDIDGFVEVLTP
jgi:photosystem II stability/assembly factor-like uncharacterized protein